MGNARDTILARIRDTLQRDDKTLMDEAVEQRLRQPSCGPQPAWKEDDVSRFINKLECVGGSISRISSEDDVISVITTYLQQHDIPLNLVSASSNLLDKLAWSDDFTVEQRKAMGTDATVLTEAYAGVAETGSLVLLSDANSPTSLNFLPDNYLCILRRELLVRHIEDVWQRLRQEHARLPRAINFITGPSRTADVEQTIQLGAHGPRRLHVILLE
ncbi:MAG: lactate utilization protein [Halobacteria archaeon]|nr:lactate utilization protein [Halobacteria archaeon]